MVLLCASLIEVCDGERKKDRSLSANTITSLRVARVQALTLDNLDSRSSNEFKNLFL